MSVITPSFRSSSWLKLCIASVADQQGVEFEHIVQDSCSDDGTQDWLPQDKRVRAFIEKDQGMYDAINRGFKRATGEILCHLNSDEQYLPGALRKVARVFEDYPDTDIVAADTVVVDSSGGYICSRKAMRPIRLTSWVRMTTTTAALFFKRAFFERHQLYFDTRWSGVADFIWMSKALEHKPKVRMVHEYTSVFTDTGENLSSQEWFQEENRRYEAASPGWARGLRPFWILLHRIRCVLNGNLRAAPFEYSIFAGNDQGTRRRFQVSRPTTRWANHG
jgi:glycosyltransferase involved in cell wall biosynthesis